MRPPVITVRKTGICIHVWNSVHSYSMCSVFCVCVCVCLDENCGTSRIPLAFMCIDMREEDTVNVASSFSCSFDSVSVG